MVMNTIICQSCGTVNNYHSSFCSDCGSKLEDKNFPENHSNYPNNNNLRLKQETNMKFFSIVRNTKYYVNTRIMTNTNEEVFSTTQKNSGRTLIIALVGGITWFVGLILTFIFLNGIFVMLFFLLGIIILVSFLITETNKSMYIDIFSKYNSKTVVKQNFNGLTNLTDFLTGRTWICQGQGNKVHFTLKFFSNETGTIHTKSGDYLIRNIRDNSGLYFAEMKEMSIIDKISNEPVVRLMCPEIDRKQKISDQVPQNYNLYADQYIDDILAIGFAVIVLYKYFSKNQAYYYY